MVAFVGSVLVLLVGTGAAMAYARRRPVDAPLTWAQAMVGGTFAFFLMFWAYGVVPHQWLSWAGNELNWRPDALILGPGSTTLENVVPFTVSKETVRDIVATLIYVVLLAAQVGVWVWWQKRGEEKPAELPASAYGRPLVRAGGEG